MECILRSGLKLRLLGGGCSLGGMERRGHLWSKVFARKPRLSKGRVADARRLVGRVLEAWRRRKKHADLGKASMC